MPGDDYRLLGIVSASDEEGNAITWSVGGDDRAAFNIMTIADRGYLRLDISPDFEDPADDDEDNAYDIIIAASDGTNVAEVPYTLTITGVNEPPLIHDFTIPDYTEIEHDFTGAPPVVHTFTATDYEGDTIYWFLQSGDADDFNLDTSGPAGKAVLQFLQDAAAGPLPDYENPRDAGSDNVYSFDVLVDDFNPQGTGLSVATVRVTNVNEKPAFTGAPTTTIARDENVGASDVLATYGRPR